MAGRRKKGEESWEHFYKDTVKEERTRFVKAGHVLLADRVLEKLWITTGEIAKHPHEIRQRYSTKMAWTCNQHMDSERTTQRIEEVEVMDPAGKGPKRRRLKRGPPRSQWEDLPSKWAGKDWRKQRRQCRATKEEESEKEKFWKAAYEISGKNIQECTANIVKKEKKTGTLDKRKENHTRRNKCGGKKNQESPMGKAKPRRNRDRHKGRFKSDHRMGKREMEAKEGQI